jgi:hypothetical protein
MVYVNLAFQLSQLGTKRLSSEGAAIRVEDTNTFGGASM